MPLFRAACVIALATMLASCAGMSEQACLASDWRTVGFEDGSRGRPVSAIGSYREACARHGVSPDLDGYRAGHADGVRTYCRPTQGFSAGRSGANYRGVCPADLEPDFLAAFESGRHLYELESSLQRVDARIAANERERVAIREEMTAIAATMAASDTTTEERVLLVSRAAELGRRHGELAAESEALSEERAIRERDLRDYQQTLSVAL